MCLCARFQASSRTSHRQAIKRIFRYLRYTPKHGLWYSASSSLSLLVFSDADFAGCRVDQKSTLGTCQFLGSLLVFWFSCKQSSVVQSTTKAEYVAAASFAHNCFGSHTRSVTLVRSVPMYLSCVIARVPLVLPKPPCFNLEPDI
jgi:hypothetical protein